MKKYQISKDELNGLLYMYYGILFGLDNSKGLHYKSCFQVKNNILKASQEAKKVNLSDLIEVVQNEC